MARAEACLGKLDSAGSKNATGEIDELKALLENETGTRGFFVVLLTGNFALSDTPPAPLLQLLADAKSHVHEVLVKNLVMSKATALVHERNKDAENLAGSNQVTRRTRNLITLLKSPSVTQQLLLMRSSIAGQSQAFKPFLDRVNYDEEQLKSVMAELDAACQQKE